MEGKTISSSDESIFDEVEEFLRAMDLSPETQVAVEKAKSKLTPDADPKMAAIGRAFPTFTVNVEEATLRTISEVSPQPEEGEETPQDISGVWSEPELAQAQAAPQESVQPPLLQATAASAEPAASSSQLPAALTRALVVYTCAQPSRLFFAHHAFVWQEFCGADRGANAYHFGDLTPQQLCAAFCGQVLPRIYVCGVSLSAHEKRCFELLELHPEYERDAQGWRRVKREARVASEHEAKARQDLCEQEADESCAESSYLGAASAEFQLDSELPQPRAPHTLVCAKAYRPRFGGYNFQFSKENAALLSAALSTDYELSDCTLFEPEELHRRLRAAKLHFEKTGQMPPNCVDAEKLCEKLRTLTEMREAIFKIFKKKFA